MIEESWRSVERELVARVVDDLLGPGAYARALRDLLTHWLKPRNPLADMLGYLPGLIAHELQASERQAVQASAAWRLLRLAAKLIDDVQDGDAIEEASTLSCGVGLIFASRWLVSRLGETGVPAERVARAAEELDRACLIASAGQFEDLGGERRDEIDADAWLHIAERKSGALLGWATWLGGLVAGADDATCEALRDYGAAIGVALQVADDYNDVWAAPGRPADEPLPARVAGSNLVAAYLRSLRHPGGSGVVAADPTRVAAQEERGAQVFVLCVGRLAQSRALGALSRAFSPTQPPPLAWLVGALLPALSHEDAL